MNVRYIYILLSDFYSLRGLTSKSHVSASWTFPYNYIYFLQHVPMIDLCICMHISRDLITVFAGEVVSHITTAVLSRLRQTLKEEESLSIGEDLPERLFSWDVGLRILVWGMEKQDVGNQSVPL